jgi:hypothetical protein
MARSPCVIFVSLFFKTFVVDLFLFMLFKYITSRGLPSCFQKKKSEKIIPFEPAGWTVGRHVDTHLTKQEAAAGIEARQQLQW